MSNLQKNLFDKLQKNANINPDEIYKIAGSVQNADFTDEKTVRDLVKSLAKMANKPISKAKEDKIVQTITKNKMPADIQSLNKLFK